MDKQELKQHLLNSSVQIELNGIGQVNVIFEKDFDDLVDKIELLKKKFERSTLVNYESVVGCINGVEAETFVDKYIHGKIKHNATT